MFFRKVFIGTLFTLALGVSFFYDESRILRVQAQSTDSSATTINLRVPGCNNNSLCEPYLGEDSLVCPSDCVNATTTPPATSTPPASTTPPGGIYYSSGTGIIVGTFTFDNLKIVAGTSSATVSWTTAVPTLSTVMWGSNTDGGQGTVSEASPRLIHNVVIYSLYPDTTYTLSIRALDVGLASVYHIYTFTTNSVEDHVPPPNIYNFKADLSFGGNIILSWENPLSSDFYKVHITRGVRYYPRDIFEGYFIYEGKDERALDTNTSPGSTYYYSAFAEDRAGNISSGAVTQFSIAALGKENNSIPPLYGGAVTVIAFATSSIRFSQDGVIILPVKEVINIDREKQLMVFVPKGIVPKYTEQSLITLSQKGVDRSYIFSELNDGSLRALIPAFLSGTYTYTIRFLARGSEVHMTGVIQTNSVLPEISTRPASNSTLITDLLRIGLFLLFWLLIIIYIIWRIYAKNRKKNDKDKTDKTS